MRIMTVATIGMLSACVAFPATAQKAAAPSWQECTDQAVKHGFTQQQKGHNEYVKDCVGGKIPGVSRASVRVARGTFEECEARAATQGLSHGQAGHIEYVRECMGRKASSPSSERR
jgi:hypothetical protein